MRRFKKKKKIIEASKTFSKKNQLIQLVENNSIFFEVANLLKEEQLRLFRGWETSLIGPARHNNTFLTSSNFESRSTKEEEMLEYASPWVQSCRTAKVADTV